MVAVARRSHPHLRFEVGTMTDLDIEDASLAGALAWYSTVHTRRWTNFPCFEGSCTRSWYRVRP
ncbi:hypothetical protein [Streptomyces mirabilis]